MNGKSDLQAAVSNLHVNLLKQNKDILESLAKSHLDQSAADLWLFIANQLNHIVPDHSKPSWLIDAVRSFSTLTFPDDYVQFAKFVVPRSPEFQEPIIVDAASVNIERVFAKQAEQQGLTSHFDKLISQLEQLIALDAIDSSLVQEAITRLQAMLNRSKQGTYATVLMTMNYGRFVLNSFAGVLKVNKYTAAVIDSFQKEFELTHESVKKADEATKRHVVAKLTSAPKMEVFLDAHPDLRQTVAGFLPAPGSSGESK